MSETYALLPVSLATLSEIRGELRSTGYEHLIDDDKNEVQLTGLALCLRAPLTDNGQLTYSGMRDDLKGWPGWLLWLLLADAVVLLGGGLGLLLGWWAGWLP